MANWKHFTKQCPDCMTTDSNASIYIRGKTLCFLCTVLAPIAWPFKPTNQLAKGKCN